MRMVFIVVMRNIIIWLGRWIAVKVSIVFGPLLVLLCCNTYTSVYINSSLSLVFFCSCYL